MSDEHEQQAREIVSAHSQHSVVVREEQLVEAIQLALSSHDAEIREVLEGLRMRAPACWCDPYPVKEHGKPCIAARALYAKLQSDAPQPPQPLSRPHRKSRKQVEEDLSLTLCTS